MNPFPDHELPLQQQADEPASSPETTTPEQSIERVAGGLRALSGVSAPQDSGGVEWGREIERQNLRAASYDDLYEVLQPSFRAYEDWVTEAVYSAWYEGRGRLLVVGCGTGALLQRLVQRMPSKLITAIDVSPQMTRRAREKVVAVPEIRTIPFDAYRPVVPFDVVAFNNSLTAMPDLRAVANHTAAMTLHGSRIVICVRNGDWRWQDAAARRQARFNHPSWYWRNWINGKRIQEITAAEEPVTSPHTLLTPAKLMQAFDGRFGLRDQRTAFGVTRLFEGVIAVPREQALQTVGNTRERRPWMRSLERLRKMDDAFAKRYPMGGGLLAMLLDKLH